MNNNKNIAETETKEQKMGFIANTSRGYDKNYKQIICGTYVKTDDGRTGRVFDINERTGWITVKSGITDPVYFDIDSAEVEATS